MPDARMQSASAVCTTLDSPQNPIPVGGNQGIQSVEEEADRRNVVDPGQRAEERPGGDGANGGLETGVDLALWRHQVHPPHASVVAETGKAVEGARLLEIDGLDGIGAGKGQKALHASGA